VYIPLYFLMESGSIVGEDNFRLCVIYRTVFIVNSLKTSCTLDYL